MCKKVIVMSMSVALLTLNLSSVVYAADTRTMVESPVTTPIISSPNLNDNIVETKEDDDMQEDTETSTIDKIEFIDEIIDIPTVDEQLDELYRTISEELDLDVKIIKIIYSLYDNKAAYASLTPDIEHDEMILSTGIKELPGYLKAPWIDNSFERDASKFLPDVLYTDCFNIKSLKSVNIENNRSNQYNSLKSEVKEQIAFYEAFIRYLDSEYIDFYPIYENLLVLKNKDENLVEVLPDGTLSIKDDFKRVLVINGINNDKVFEALALLFAYDNYLVESLDTSDLHDYSTLPFELNKNTHENMILAASSVVGKCRYVWGGGHDGTSYIDGINPAWALWNEAYNGSSGSIRPAGSYCPIHGQVSGECSYINTVHSADEYLNSRKDIMDIDSIDTKEYEELLKNTGMNRGLSAHRLDGLDCSGFVSWVYNQVTDEKQYNAVAKDYVNAMGLKSLPMGSDLKPGDVFAWSTHIIMIVAPYNEKCNVYLTVESVPDVVGFGVAYYSGAKSSDIAAVEELATELNCLIGGLNSDQARVRKYCLNTKGTYKVTDEIEVWSEDGEVSTVEEVRYEKFSILGRYPGEFEEVYIDEYHKNFSEMYAVEMMQYVVDKLPYEYLSGYNKYINSDNKLIKSDNIRMWE